MDKQIVISTLSNGINLAVLVACFAYANKKIASLDSKICKINTQLEHIVNLLECRQMPNHIPYYGQYGQYQQYPQHVESQPPQSVPPNDSQIRNSINMAHTVSNVVDSFMSKMDGQNGAMFIPSPPVPPTIHKIAEEVDTDEIASELKELENDK